MNLAIGELPVPFAAEEFRRRRFGGEYEPPLAPHEYFYAKSIVEDLKALAFPIWREQAHAARRAVENYLDYAHAAGAVDALAKKVRLAVEINNTGIHAARTNGQSVLVTMCAEAKRAGRDSPLPQRQTIVENQQATVRLEMIDALIKGQLLFRAINCANGEVNPGRPDFWRSDFADAAFRGERIPSNGSVFLAVIEQRDLDSYFAEYAPMVATVIDGIVDEGEARVPIAGEPLAAAKVESIGPPEAPLKKRTSGRPPKERNAAKGVIHDLHKGGMPLSAITHEIVNRKLKVGPLKRGIDWRTYDAALKQVELELKEGMNADQAFG
jgi:hypothetical protein